MRVEIITNPFSGRGAGPTLASEVASEMHRRGHATEIHHGSDADDAACWAREAAPAADRLAVVGGDGTLNAVLAGLPQPCPPVAFTPLGTSNLVAHEFGLPRSARKVADLLERGRIQRLDLGEVNGRRTFMVWDFGTGGELMRRMEESRNGPLRKSQYFPHFFRMVRGWRPPALTVTADGEDLGAFEYGIVAGLSRYGFRFFRLGPSDYTDGRWELYLLNRLRMPNCLRLAAAALFGRLYRARGVVHRRVRQVRVEGSTPSPVQVDGDFAGHTPVEFKVLDVQLPLLVPSP